MSTVIIWPGRRHARASATLFANAASVSSETMRPSPGKAGIATRSAQYIDGIPRVRQPLTVGEEMLSDLATAPVPPSASMIAPHVSDESVIGIDLVRKSRTGQGVAYCETTFRTAYGAMASMDTDDDIRLRLIAVREHLGKTQTEFAEALGLGKNVYNPFETGKRPLTMEAARRIRKRFGISIDWLLFGDVGQPSEIIARNMGPQPKQQQRLPEPRKAAAKRAKR
nr:helix-turn-helix transcriptional regulator [Bradyrhizobium sp. SZCCHNS3002]